MTKSLRTPTELNKKHTKWFLPALLEEVRAWPKNVREDVGRQLNKVEYGREPIDFKPIKTIGAGVNEIRHSDDGDQSIDLHRKIRRSSLCASRHHQEEVAAYRKT